MATLAARMAAYVALEKLRQAPPGAHLPSVAGLHATTHDTVNTALITARNNAVTTDASTVTTNLAIWKDQTLV